MSDEEPQVRSSLVGVLGSSKSDHSFDAMLIALKDKDASVRSAAARSLGQRNDKRSVDALAVAAQDADDGVMAAASSALEAVSPGHPVVRENVKKLIGLFRSDTRSKFTAAQALGHIGTPETAAVLTDSLGSGDKMEKSFALLGLMMCEKIPDVTPILRCLGDEDGHIKMHAVMVLDRVDPPQLIEWIAPLLNDSDPHTKMIVASTLMRRGDERGEKVLKCLSEEGDERDRKIVQRMLENVTRS